jgi:hypothetical protein
LLAVTAAVVALAVGVAVGVAVAGEDQPDSGGSTVQVVTSPSSSPSESGASFAPATEEPPLKLVPGTRLVNGVRVGYPHTVVGAVSAAVEYSTQAGATLDPQRSRQIADAVAHPPAYGGNPEGYFAQGVIDTRRYLGLPTVGPVPQGASQTFGALTYQLREERADEVTVLMMAYLTLIAADRGMEQRLILVPSRLVWDGADWKTALRPEGATEYLELRRKPGTPESRAAGWRSFITP